MNYDKNKYRKIDWKHIMMLHWVINPGIMFNELALGQRVPRVMLQERSREKPWIERFKVPCPHCETIHDGRTWSIHNKTAFKNWFGLYCSACGGVIPCLWNIGSFLALAVTAPVWYWFKRPLCEKWLRNQPARYANLNLSQSGLPKYTWVKQGIFFGLFMFIVNDLVDQMSEQLNYKKLAIGFIVWMLCGLLFGLMMRATTSLMFGKKKGS